MQQAAPQLVALPVMVHLVACKDHSGSAEPVKHCVLRSQGCPAYRAMLWADRQRTCSPSLQCVASWL